MVATPAGLSTTGIASRIEESGLAATRGIPTIAITSAGDVEMLKRIAHGPDDTVDRVDCRALADVAQFVRAPLVPSPGA